MTTEQTSDPTMKPHRGSLILIFGILSLFGICSPLGVAAWIMGNTDLKQMTAGTMDPGGRGITNGGRICGIIGTVLMILAVVFYVILMLIGVFAAVAHAV